MKGDYHSSIIIPLLQTNRQHRLFLEEVAEEVVEVHSDPPVQFLTTPGHFLIIPLLSSPYSRLTQPRLFLEEVMEEVTEEVAEVHSDPLVQFVTTSGHFPLTTYCAR